MIHEPFRNDFGDMSEKREDRSGLPPEEHMEIDVQGVAQRCVREGIIPEDLQITENGMSREALIARVDLQLLAMLRALPGSREMPNEQESSRTFHLSENRRSGKSVAEDIQGIIRRCIRENVRPDDLKLTEIGPFREILIRKTKQTIIETLREASINVKPSP